MKTRLDQWLTAALFCAFLFAMAALYLFLPKSDFSQQEKRYLAKTPELTWSTLAEGEFSADVDTFMADHIPGRSFFVGLNAYCDLLTGRQGAKDILLTRDDRLVEAPAQADWAALEKNMSILNKFAENSKVPVDLMVVPSAGWAAQDLIVGLHDPYQDEEILAGIYAMAGDSLGTVDVASAFAATGAPEQLYYKTDHHWTSLGACTGYEVYMAHLGKDACPRTDFLVETIPGFRGSTHSRSALWGIPGEDLELWHSEDPITVLHEESAAPHEGVFFRNRLDESDKYTVFLDGNHSIVRLHNEAAAGKGSLLVIRDSFSNCLGSFLAESFENVVLIDLRYYRQAASELMAQETFDQVLICYSIGNFLTDTNIVWLR